MCQKLIAVLKQTPKLIAKLNKTIIYERPELESIRIKPTLEEQKITPNKYGFNEVTVEGIETEELEVTPNKESQSFSGIYGKVNVVGDENLLPENIKNGRTVFGVPGDKDVVSTKDADATPEDILAGKTAYVNGEKITGTVEISGDENATVDDSRVTSNTSTSEQYLLNKMITKLPADMDITKLSSIAYLFNGCENLQEIPNIDTSNVLKMNYTFQNCKSIVKLPQLNTSNVTDMSGMCNGCTNLTEPPSLDISNVTKAGYMFASCTNLVNPPQLTSSKKLGQTGNMFSSCTNLTKAPEFDTSGVTDMSYMFYYCSGLTEMPLMDMSSVTSVNYFVNVCRNLTHLGGFKDLGKAYTTKSNNSTYYRLDLSSCTLLTHESLMNVINNLYDLNLSYDVANGGTLYRQRVQLGSTNLAKLTAEEIAIATNKGWDLV